MFKSDKCDLFVPSRDVFPEENDRRDCLNADEADQTRVELGQDKFLNFVRIAVVSLDYGFLGFFHVPVNNQVH